MVALEEDITAEAPENFDGSFSPEVERCQQCIEGLGFDFETDPSGPCEMLIVPDENRTGGKKSQPFEAAQPVLSRLRAAGTGLAFHPAGR